MANLDNLNFNVIINDTDFNAKCDAMLKKAQALNVQLSKLLNFSKKQSRATREEEAALRRANRIHLDNVKTREKEKQAIEKTLQKQRELNSITNAKINKENAKWRGVEAREAAKTEAVQRRINNSMSKQNVLLRQLSSFAATYVSIWGASQFLKNMVRVSSEFEMQRRTLQYIIQDSYMGMKIFNQMKELAVMSPFTFKELMSYTKQLSAFSVPKNELFETTKMLADVSAGLGVGMDRLILAYGQIRSASFLRGQEVRQLTEAGVPILEELRKQFIALGEEGITVGDVFDKISNRLVPFEMVEKVFKNMTSEGGKFYKMQEFQAGTLQGKISNLKDAYEIMFAEIGEKGDSILKDSVDMLRSFAENWEVIGQSIIRLTSLFGTFYASMSILRISNYIVAVGGLANAVKSLTIVQKALNLVVSANPYVIAAAAVAGLAVAIYQLVENSNALKEAINSIAFDMFEDMTKSLNRFDALKRALDNATEGSQNYQDAIASLNNEFGEHFSNLLREKDAVDQLSSSYEAVTASIRSKARVEAESLSRDKIEDMYGDARDNYARDIITRLGERGVSADVASRIWNEFTTTLNEKIEQGATDYKFIELFEDAWAKVVGEDGISQIEKFGNKIKQNTLFTRNVFGVNTTGWETLLTSIDNYGIVLQTIARENSVAETLLDGMFPGTVPAEKILEKEKEINEIYDKQREELLNQNVAQKEREKILNDIEIARQEALKAAYTELGVIDKASEAQKRIDDLKKTVVGFGEMANKVLDEKYGVYKKGAGISQYFVTPETTRNDYIDKLRKDYKDLLPLLEDAKKLYKSAQEDFEGGFVTEEGVAKEKKNLDYLILQKSAIEDVAKALGIQLEEEKKTNNRPTKDPRITELERLSTLLKDVMRLYGQYVELGALSEEQALKILSDIYGDRFNLAEGDLLNFDEILKKIISDLNALGEDGQRSARAVEESFDRMGKKDMGTDLLDSMRAYINFQANMKKLLDKNYGVDGEDIGYNLSKIALGVINSKSADTSAYENAVKEIDKLKPFVIAKAQADGKENAEAEWTAYREEALSQLEELYKQKNRADVKGAQEKINDMGRKFVTDTYFKTFGKENPLSELTDKSIFALAKIRNQIKGILNTLDAEGLQITDEVNSQINEAGLSVKDLLDIIKKIINAGKDEADQTFFEKLADSARKTAGFVSESLESIGSLYSVRGNEETAALLSMIGEGIETTASVMDSISNGHYMEASLQALSFAVSTVTQYNSELYQARKNMQDLEIATNSFFNEQKLNGGVDSIFGTNDIQGLRNGIEALKEAQDELSKLWEKNEDLKTRLTVGEQDWVWQSVPETISRIWGLDASDPEQLLQGIDNLLNSRGRFEWGANLSENDVDFLVQLRAATENFLASQEQVKAAIQDMWSGVAQSMTDSMISAYIEMGDAAVGLKDNMSSIFAELGKDIASSLIQNFVIDNILSKYEGQVTALYSRMVLGATPEQTAQDFASIANGIIQDSQKAAEFTNRIMDALTNAGFVFDSEGGESLANGISGITEDTANLLASYINAIRADVSYNKAQIAGISTDLKVLLGLVPQTNTLEFYLQTLAAHSQNVAINTSNILSELRSVITNENGLTSVRTFNS